MNFEIKFYFTLPHFLFILSIMNYIIGIDEAGRGPLAGPVAVGVALVRVDFDWDLLPGVNDSKQLSEKRREEIYVTARKLKASAHLDFAVSMVSAGVIDKYGIVNAVHRGIETSLKKLEKSIAVNSDTKDLLFKKCQVKLDGGLRAPERFEYQETIIKGDSKEKVIGLASIMAKVTRDRYMVREAATPLAAPYNFAAHKGYGTKAHCEAIREHGLHELHRRSFCKNILNTL